MCHFRLVRLLDSTAILISSISLISEMCHFRLVRLLDSTAIRISSISLISEMCHFRLVRLLDSTAILISSISLISEMCHCRLVRLLDSTAILISSISLISEILCRSEMATPQCNFRLHKGVYSFLHAQPNTTPQTHTWCCRGTRPRPNLDNRTQ
jgi:hypothetical protein